VSNSAERRIREVSRRPTVRVWVVSATGVQVDRFIGSTPDYHFAARPQCSVVPSRLRRIDDAGGCPTVRVRVVSAAGVEPDVGIAEAAPDDHFAAGPYCAVLVPRERRIGSASSYPTIGDWIVPTARVYLSRITTVALSTPYNHLGASPHAGMQSSGDRCVDEARRYPAVGSRIVRAAGVQTIGG
jgi:hypothetical protein